jgi:hypothetical protein
MNIIEGQSTDSCLKSKSPTFISIIRNDMSSIDMFIIKGVIYKIFHFIDFFFGDQSAYFIYLSSGQSTVSCLKSKSPTFISIIRNDMSSIDMFIIKGVIYKIFHFIDFFFGDQSAYFMLVLANDVARTNIVFGYVFE